MVLKRIMKWFKSHFLLVLYTFGIGIVAAAGWYFFGCERGPTDTWKTYANGQYGYRLRYPEGWKVWDRGELYLCSPRIKFPCGRTPHEVYATVGVRVSEPEGLPLTEYLRSPARGYNDLRELRVGGVQAFATGPVDGDTGWLISERFIDEQVHLLHGGKVYTITSYAIDGCPGEFEKVLATFELTK